MSDGKYAAAARAIRAMRGWNQTEMGRRLGLAGSAISRIESGVQDAQPYIVSICEAGGIELADLDALLKLVERSDARIGATI